MTINEKRVLATLSFLTLTSIAILVAVIALSLPQRVEKLSSVQFPDVLQQGVVPTPDFVATEAIGIHVPGRRADDFYNALITDIDAHGGIITGYSREAYQVQAIVPEGYFLGRLSPLRIKSSEWFHPNYQEWFENSKSFDTASSWEAKLDNFLGPTIEINIRVYVPMGPSALIVWAFLGSIIAVVLSVTFTVAAFAIIFDDKSVSWEADKLIFPAG